MKRARIIAVTFISLVLLIVILRGPVIRMAVLHKAKGLAERHSLLIGYKKLKITGLSTVRMEDLWVCQKERDTLFFASRLRIRVNPVKMLALRPDIRQLEADSINISFIKADSSSNFDFLFGGKKQKEHVRDTLQGPQPGRANFSRNADRLYSLLRGVIPSDADLKTITVKYVSDGYRLSIFTPELQINDGVFSTVIQSNENGVRRNLNFDGQTRGNEVYVRLSPEGGKKFAIPFISFRWGARAEFDTLSFRITDPVRDGDHISVSGTMRADGISLFHKRLSSTDVRIDRGSVDYTVNIGRNFFEFDSVSLVTLNDFVFSPYLMAQRGEKWRLTARLNKKSFPADELFRSLPRGLFYNLEGIRTSGNLSYHFLLDIDFARVDSLKLESVLTPENFRIREFGNTDFRRINGEFEYTAYEKGVAVRSFMVGPSNRNFRTLDRISPYLQMAVLQSEDGGFFYHHGFLPESMREALAQDIKERRFHRGGSTISMQLVKNVFLSRNKTLTRKFEEVMIVWLIEGNRLSSKERMFEVYMNIIEWGPGVYGANEAARFYFDKDARELSVNEAIFLASIIPAPKWSLNSFTDDMQLKPQMEGYYRLMAQRLRIKGMITEAEEAAVRPEVRLRGEARELIRTRAVENELPRSEIRQ